MNGPFETVIHTEDIHDEYLTWKAERGKIGSKLYS